MANRPQSQSTFFTHLLPILDDLDALHLHPVYGAGGHVLAPLDDALGAEQVGAAVGRPHLLGLEAHQADAA